MTLLVPSKDSFAKMQVAITGFAKKCDGACSCKACSCTGACACSSCGTSCAYCRCKASGPPH